MIRVSMVAGAVAVLSATCLVAWSRREEKTPLVGTLPPPNPRIAEAERVAVVDNCDVAVLGGTPSGVAAAIAAARAGAKVVLVEPRPLLGGDLTYAWINQFDVPVQGIHSARSDIDYGIFGEFYHKLGLAFAPERARVLVEQKIAAEPNIRVMTSTSIEHLNLDNGRLRSVLLHQNGKWVRLNAPAWVDASNDGDVAATAGSGFTLGREQANADRAMQSAGLFFRIGPVNWDEVRAYTHKLRRLPLAVALALKPTILKSSDAKLRGDQIVILLGGGVGSYAWERGDIVKGYRPHGPNIEVMSINFGQATRNEVVLNTLNILGVNGLEKESRVAGRKEAVEELKYLVPFLRGRMPGFERAQLLSAAPELYIRETRHISGLTTLTTKDVKDSTVFPDRIALCSYSIDLHPYKRGEPPSATHPWVFTMPLSALIPKRVDGLFVASRSLSATWMAAGAARVIPVTMAAGQAAGLCAAMCAQDAISPHDFVADSQKVGELQDALRAKGVNIGDNATELAAERAARFAQKL